ncbi:hypothetical protein [Streptomyces sp. NPDC003006]
MGETVLVAEVDDAAEVIEQRHAFVGALGWEEELFPGGCAAAVDEREVGLAGEHEVGLSGAHSGAARTPGRQFRKEGPWTRAGTEGEEVPGPQQPVATGESLAAVVLEYPDGEDVFFGCRSQEEDVVRSADSEIVVEGPASEFRPGSTLCEWAPSLIDDEECVAEQCVLVVAKACRYFWGR